LKNFITIDNITVEKTDFGYILTEGENSITLTNHEFAEIPVRLGAVAQHLRCLSYKMSEGPRKD